MKGYFPLRASCIVLAALIAFVLRFIEMLYEQKFGGEANDSSLIKQEAAR